MAKTSENQKFKNAIAYIPFLGFLLFFIEQKKTKEYEKHLRYSMILCWVWIVSLIMFRWMFWSIATLAYFIAAGYLAYKAYNGEDQEIDVIDNIFKK